MHDNSKYLIQEISAGEKTPIARMTVTYPPHQFPTKRPARERSLLEVCHSQGRVRNRKSGKGRRK